VKRSRVRRACLLKERLGGFPVVVKERACGKWGLVSIKYLVEGLGRR